MAQTKILKAKITKARSEVKPRSYHDDSPSNQCPYQVGSSHNLRFPRYGPDKILNSWSLWQDQRSNQGHMMLHTYTP